MHRDDVVSQFGAPDAALSRDVWVYWDFRGKGRPGGESADTLIVVFIGDRVSRLRMTERQPVMALVNQLRARAANKHLFARK